MRGVLGAIDGTHIFCQSCPETLRAAHRNRKGAVTQNVLAACTFDMLFCYVLSGMEGSASDSWIFEQARSLDLLVPDGYFYLGDAGFPSCRALLVPYRGVRYHLREWAAGNLK
jgi:hypothetical protein